jgi:phenylpyruvate tautomerase PptA (4-oxalocrotonate tautomerase family)
VGTKPLGERVRGGETDRDRVWSARQSGVQGVIDEAIFLFRTDRLLRFVVLWSCGIMLFLAGLAIGKIAFSTTTLQTNPADGAVVITEAQADDYQQTLLELEQVKSDLAISQGTAAFHETQAAKLAEEVSQLHSELSRAQLERNLTVNVYEECVERSHPRECIENAEPELDGFLAELYSEDHG